MVRTKRMKRLMMLGALILIFALVGCNNAPQTPTPTTSTEPPQTPEATTLHPDLIDSMVKYLQQLTFEYDMPTYGFDDKITFILNGKRAFHVKFSSADYYYACGYATLDAEHVQKREKDFYCCAENYTWVRFDNEADISETYNGQELIVTLQVNKATVCQDILQDTWDGSTMEHYQLYFPQFENGKNIASAVEFDSEFIFLSDSEKLNLYCCEDYYFFENATLPCIELEGKSYLTHHLYWLLLDGSRNEIDLQVHFGAYYNPLMEIMITDQYNVPQANGTVAYYGLFELGEFADLIKGIDEAIRKPAY